MHVLLTVLSHLVQIFELYSIWYTTFHNPCFIWHISSKCGASMIFRAGGLRRARLAGSGASWGRGLGHRNGGAEGGGALAQNLGLMRHLQATSSTMQALVTRCLRDLVPPYVRCQVARRGALNLSRESEICRGVFADRTSVQRSVKPLPTAPSSSSASAQTPARITGPVEVKGP